MGPYRNSLGLMGTHEASWGPMRRLMGPHQVPIRCHEPTREASHGSPWGLMSPLMGRTKNITPSYLEVTPSGPIRFTLAPTPAPTCWERARPVAHGHTPRRSHTNVSISMATRRLTHICSLSLPLAGCWLVAGASQPLAAWACSLQRLRRSSRDGRGGQGSKYWRRSARTGVARREKCR